MACVDPFATIRALIDALDHSGRPDLAARLREGLGRINGLTDGAAAFLAAVEAVGADPAFPPSLRAEIEKVHAAAFHAVHRRRPMRARSFVRAAVFLVACLLVAAGPVGSRLRDPAVESPGASAVARAVPGSSPFAVGLGALGGREFSPALWCLPPLALLLLAAWRGRWFCRWACPAGTLLAWPAPSGRRPILPWRLCGVFFWVALAAAAAGAPVLLALDPLSAFSRLGGFGGEGGWTAWVPGLLLPLMLLLGLRQPQLWCSHLCPLGYSFELAHGLVRHPGKTLDRQRREILAGLALGLPLAFLQRKGLAKRREEPIPPPGAGRPEVFAAVCSRCAACAGVCPTGVIRPASPSEAGLAGWFAPRLDFDRAGCAPGCSACTRACPTGALRPLSPAAKDALRLGLAEISRPRCLAWSAGEECMACQEACPWSAVEAVFDGKEVACPEVTPDRCRGCGFCQAACPVQPKAIRVGRLKG